MQSDNECMRLVVVVVVVVYQHEQVLSSSSSSEQLNLSRRSFSFYLATGSECESSREMRNGYKRTSL